MTPSWYDVLDVDEDATPAEIRTAWKAAIADLEPGDRRFRLANQAAEVLLDPEKRAAHDADLADASAEDADDGAEDEPAGEEAGEEADEIPLDDEVDVEPAGDEPADDEADVDAVDEPADDVDDETEDEDEADDDDRDAARSRPLFGVGWRDITIVVVAAVLVIVLLPIAVLALVQGIDVDDDDATGLPDERRVQDARGAAEAAVVPVLAYDYRTLEQDQADARTYLTEGYAEEYDRFFAAAVETNAPRTQTVVKVRVLDSAIVRTGEDRVDVLLFVNRPTTNRQRRVEYRDQVTMRMLDVDGTWLVDCMITTGTGPCEDD